MLKDQEINQYKNKVKKLEKEVGKLEKEVEKLNSAITIYKNEVAKLGRSIDYKNNLLTNLTYENKKLKGAVIGLAIHGFDNEWKVE